MAELVGAATVLISGPAFEAKRAEIDQPFDAYSFTATSRPTKLVVCTGRFPGTASNVRNGGNSTRNVGARTW